MAEITTGTLSTEEAKAAGLKPGSYVTSEGVFEIKRTEFGVEVIRTSSVGQTGSPTVYIEPAAAKELPLEQAEVSRAVREQAIEFQKEAPGSRVEVRKSREGLILTAGIQPVMEEPAAEMVAYQEPSERVAREERKPRADISDVVMAAQAAPEIAKEYEKMGYYPATGQVTTTTVPGGISLMVEPKGIIDIKKLEKAAEMSMGKATPLEWAGLHATTLLSPKGYKYIGSYFAPEVTPKEVIKERIVTAASAAEQGRMLEHMAQSAIENPVVEIELAALGTMAMESQMGKAVLAKPLIKGAVISAGVAGGIGRGIQMKKAYEEKDIATALGLGITTGADIAAGMLGAKMMSDYYKKGLQIKQAEIGTAYPTEEGGLQISKVRTQLGKMEPIDSEVLTKYVTEGDKSFAISRVVTGEGKEFVGFGKGVSLPEVEGITPSIAKGKVITEQTGKWASFKRWVAGKIGKKEEFMFKPYEETYLEVAKAKYPELTVKETPEIIKRGMLGYYTEELSDIPISEAWEIAKKGGWTPHEIGLAKLPETEIEARLAGWVSKEYGIPVTKETVIKHEALHALRPEAPEKQVLKWEALLPEKIESSYLTTKKIEPSPKWGYKTVETMGEFISKEPSPETVMRIGKTVTEKGIKGAYEGLIKIASSPDEFAYAGTKLLSQQTSSSAADVARAAALGTIKISKTSYLAGLGGISVKPSEKYVAPVVLPSEVIVKKEIQITPPAKEVTVSAPYPKITSPPSMTKQIVKDMEKISVQAATAPQVVTKKQEAEFSKIGQLYSPEQLKAEVKPKFKRVVTLTPTEVEMSSLQQKMMRESVAVMRKPEFDWGSYTGRFVSLKPTQTTTQLTSQLSKQAQELDKQTKTLSAQLLSSQKLTEQSMGTMPRTIFTTEQEQLVSPRMAQMQTKALEKMMETGYMQKVVPRRAVPFDFSFTPPTPSRMGLPPMRRPRAEEKKKRISREKMMRGFGFTRIRPMPFKPMDWGLPPTIGGRWVTKVPRKKKAKKKR